MTIEEKVQRRKELAVLEAELKNKKDFGKLVQLHDEAMVVGGAVGDYIDRLPQKAYCLARLGKKEEMLQTLQQFSGYQMILDSDELQLTVQLVFLFTTAPVSAFTDFHFNSLQNYLNSPHTEIVEKIVFDYKEILQIGDLPTIYSTDGKFAMVFLDMDELQLIGQLIYTNVIPDLTDDDMLIDPKSRDIFFIKESYVEKIYQQLLNYAKMIKGISHTSHGERIFERAREVFFKVQQASMDLEDIHPMSNEIRSQLRNFRFTLPE